jgi:hypothetical protein
MTNRQKWQDHIKLLISDFETTCGYSLNKLNEVTHNIQLKYKSYTSQQLEKSLNALLGISVVVTSDQQCRSRGYLFFHNLRDLPFEANKGDYKVVGVSSTRGNPIFQKKGI